MDKYSEAHYARIEIFETNRNHIPWINVWMIIQLALYALHLVLSQVYDIVIWQLLVLVPWAGLPAIGMFIRAEALVRRHWTLWWIKSEETGINPDHQSRGFVFQGNVYGYLLPILVITLGAQDVFETRIMSQALYGFASVMFLLGIVSAGRAAAHKPAFAVGE